jgi:cephalosporin hydroxylase
MSQDHIDEFHKLYYDSRERTWKNTSWLGVGVQKCPLDLWVYQEILAERRPDVIVETGTAAGGSALFLATVCDLIRTGVVVTVDVEERPNRPVHRRIRYVLGSSVSEQTIREVGREIAEGAKVMAILDSDHSRDHVLAELRLYGELVSSGQYLIVEDTNINGHPVRSDFGPGPAEAISDFLAETDAFEIDREREKFLMTFNPGGFLRKIF